MEVHDLEIQTASQQDTENAYLETKAHMGDSKIGSGERLNIMLNEKELKETGRGVGGGSAERQDWGVGS